MVPVLLGGEGASGQERGDVREVHAPHGTPEREESIRRSGGRTTVPQIFIGESAIGGSDDLHALEAAGRLDALLTSG